jgi:hypothetical protein
MQWSLCGFMGGSHLNSSTIINAMPGLYTIKSTAPFSSNSVFVPLVHLAMFLIGALNPILPDVAYVVEVLELKAVGNNPS